VEFRDPATAARNLGLIRRFAPRKVYDSLAPLLIGSPNPDDALNQFERLVRVESGGLFHLLEEHAFLVHYAIVVFGYSLWLGETLIHNPDLFQGFVREKSLDRSRSHDEFQESFARFQARSFEADAAALLARFKRREYVRIMLRDVLGIASLSETTAELSALADVLIAEALREVYAQVQRRFGSPQGVDRDGKLADARFAVLSLGKLGGNELNYSSDIDLLYLYDAGLEQEGRETSNREYFIRLAQQTTELLSRPTPEGPVFRIDLRLRPQGNDGEPAVRLAHAVHYYSNIAHDWELQAMIKARYTAGDMALAREFLRAVQPYVYQGDLNFAAIKTALVTREKIGTHRRQRRLTQPGEGGIDVKIDRGGIRDIEFLVQCLQRIYGGSESWLRSRGTMFALQKLHDKKHIASRDFDNLSNAYQFLRNLEHRLQLRHGRQTHRLPQSYSELQSLARSLPREGMAGFTPEEFMLSVQGRMAAVAEIYQRIIYQEQSREGLDSSQEFQLKPELSIAPEDLHGLTAQRFTLDSPHLREIVNRPELSQHARRNLERFLTSAGTTAERYGAVLRSPNAVERALKIFELSEYLTDVLVRHPGEILLVGQIADHPVPKAGLFDENLYGERATGDPVYAYLAQEGLDHGEAMCILRRHYRQQVFLSGARDLFQSREAFTSLHENTAAADAAIQAALAAAGSPDGFAVIGLGRLGACEFDLLSDADVVFVCGEHSDNEEMRRVAERVMELLTAYTRDGTVFPVDARLRPHGREGELIVTPAQLATYFEDEAKPWEALTYLKMRHVAGDGEVADRALLAVQKGIERMAERPDFAAELQEVRSRLEGSEAGPNFKTGPGGTYDLDYLAGALQARHKLWLVGDLRERLRLLHVHGWVEDEIQQLTEGALFLRTLEHVVRLVTGRAGKWLPVAEHAYRSVQEVLRQLLGAERGSDLETRLRQVLQQNREIYIRHWQV